MTPSRCFAFAAFALVALASGSAQAMTVCHLTYHLEGWSAFYKQYSGTGTVTCENGQRANVSIVTRGGGITFGKSEIDGRGRFSAVENIEEIYGSYAEAGGHAGVTRSAEGRVMTKGEVSLSLGGTGRGVDLGFVFGAFIIGKS